MINREILMRGHRYRKKIKVAAYDDEIEIRALTEVEVTKIMRILESEGINPKESDETLSTNYRMLYWACRFGITDKSITGPLPDDMQAEMREGPDDKFIYTGVDIMIGSSMRQIGSYIISISSAGAEEVKDFLKAPKETT